MTVHGEKFGKVLLLGGGGEVGSAAATRFALNGATELVLHSRTLEHAERAQRRLRLLGLNVAIETGDLFGPGFAESDRAFDYFYDEVSPDIVARSPLYQLIAKHRPDVIVDCVNSATVLGYEQDPYTAARKVHACIRNKEPLSAAIDDFLGGQFVPRLIRFVQALDFALGQGVARRYVKVSTTGLGGMGLNVPYTHGDIADAGLSVAILGKVAAAGVLLQLLWSLSHTPGRDVQVIVPAALVGWEEPELAPLVHGDTIVRRLARTASARLVDGEPVGPTSEQDVQPLLAVAVNSGENLAYSRAEMAAITALNQMEAVTKEEVAAAVVDAATGSHAHDLLSGMDRFMIGPSFAGAIQRSETLRRLDELSAVHGATIATGNLGPRVAKDLAELHLLIEAAGGLAAAANCRADELSRRAADVLLANERYLAQLLGIGLGVLLPDSRYLLGSQPAEPIGNVVVTADVLDRWVRTWWVDLRPARAASWIAFFADTLESVATMAASGVPRFDANWQALRNNLDDPGELLALHYLRRGGGRLTRGAHSDAESTRSRTENTK